MSNERIAQLESEVAHLRVQLAQMEVYQRRVAAEVQRMLDERQQPKGKALREAERNERESQIEQISEAISEVYLVTPDEGNWFSPSEILEHLSGYGLEIEGSDQAQKRLLAEALKRAGVKSRRKAEGVVYVGLTRPIA